MVKQTHLILISIVVLLLAFVIGGMIPGIPGFIAGDTTTDDMKEGTIAKASTEITMDKGMVTFTDKANGLSASTTTTINGVAFVPSKTTEGKELIWSTGELDPIVKMVYSYDGKTLKEIITLKEDKVLTFPITLATYSKLIPWDNGQWKIVASNSFETMKGIVLEKPYGIDANGKRIEMEYTYEKGVLTLVYDRTITEWVEEEKIVIDNKTSEKTTEIVWVPKYSAITYPLVIDPTWVAIDGHWIDNTANATYTVEMWNATGTTSWTPPAGVASVEYLVIAGGGGGTVAGGGAGGYRNSVKGEQTGGGGVNETPLSVSSTILVKVGAGGAPGITSGTNGYTSAFGSIDADGGGRGGSGSTSSAPGYAGGSGGGGGFNGAGGVANTSIVQGKNGGNGGAYSGSYAKGGGGGAGTVGGNANSGTSVAGNGGDGLSSSITGTPVIRAGGGGGGQDTGTLGIGGSGGGGDAVRTGAANAGVNGTGSGGGANNNDATGGYGGSGIVIIKYLTPQTDSTFTSKNISSSINVTAGWVGLEPFTMQFNDTSTGTPTNWSWGTKNIAGNNTWVSLGTTNNITTIFSGGYWAVNLTATNPHGSNISQNLYISVIGNGTPAPSVVTPVASFYGSPTIGSPPLLIYLTDASSNTPTSWNWSYGNGLYSETQNPSYTYTKSGFYTVGLTATNSAGSNTTSKVRYITAY